MSFFSGSPPYISSGKSRSSKRLAGLLPLSINDASLVARRIRSGKLVRLPRASAALTASISRRGGRRSPDNLEGLSWRGVFDAADGSVALAFSNAFNILSAVNPEAPMSLAVFWDEELEEPST